MFPSSDNADACIMYSKACPCKYCCCSSTLTFSGQTDWLSEILFLSSKGIFENLFSLKLLFNFSSSNETINSSNSSGLGVLPNLPE
jgi:hypothetical protein